MMLIGDEPADTDECAVMVVSSHVPASRLLALMTLVFQLGLHAGYAQSKCILKGKAKIAQVPHTQLSYAGRVQHLFAANRDSWTRHLKYPLMEEMPVLRGTIHCKMSALFIGAHHTPAWHNLGNSVPKQDLNMHQ